MRSLIETLPGPLVVFDKAGTLRMFNPAAEQLFGHEAAEVIGKDAGILIMGGLSDHAHGGVRCMATGRRRNGSTFPLELVLSELRSGNRRYLAGFATDLTEHHDALSRLEALQDNMIHAGRLNLMGTMASAMAHEVNQPLSAISNYLKGLKHATVAGQAAELAPILDRTAEQAVRAGQIIGRLRDFVTRGETDRRLESIGTLIEEASTLSRMATRDAGLRITVSLDPRSDAILADRIQIQQVLLNLMRNAIQAMAGAERREVTISTIAGSDGLLAIKVADTGKGLSADAAARLFQPFATTKPDGMGLGLAISRMIVDAHGGRIWHEPGPDGGAAFCFTLPAVTQAELDHAA